MLRWVENRRGRRWLLLFLLGGCIGLKSLPAQTVAGPAVHVIRLAEHFHLLDVNGKVNMLVFNGPEGALLVDTGSEHADLIEAALQEIGVEKIKYIINTHSHDDHVAGNARLGQGAVIVSSRRCREKLLKETGFPAAGLPALTFTDQMSISLNGEHVDLYFMPGHSDDGIAVHFRQADMACIGDIGFFKPAFCWPGLSGNVYDIEMSLVRLNYLFTDSTVLVHGHTRNYAMADLRRNIEMVQEAIRLVRPAMEEGLSLEQIKARNPLKASHFELLRDYAGQWIMNIVRDVDNQSYQSF